MIDKILVPLDGSTASDQILPIVKICAEGFQAAVQLLKVNDPRILAPYSPPLQGKDHLERMRAAYLPEPLPVECIVELGKPAKIIAGRCGDDHRCLIAMATNGVTGARRWLLGSVTSRVVQTATQPILLVRPSEQAPPNPALKTIIIGLDGSELAEKVLPYAKAFAKKLNLGVLLLHAFEIPIDALLMRGADYAQRFAERKAGLQKSAQDYLETQARQLRDDGIGPVAATILEGSPASALIESAERHDGSLIAMATHGRSGFNRWIMGSVAEIVVHHAGAPVLLVRAG